MHTSIHPAAFVFALALLMTGCASTQQADPAMSALDDSTYQPPASIYSVMDSTALVYSNPAAAAPVHDNPYRWVGFILHPVGQALDYGINRPLYKLAGSGPYLFGYTSEDAMLDSQRR